MDIKTIEKNLNNLKREVNSAKIERAEELGRQKELEAGLRNEFNVRSLEDAQAKIEEIQKKEDSAILKIQKDYGNLESGYQW